jgi:DNA-binding SARP family transcriptional activator
MDPSAAAAGETPSLPEMHRAIVQALGAPLEVRGRSAVVTLQSRLLPLLWHGSATLTRELSSSLAGAFSRQRHKPQTPVIAGTLEALCLWQQGKNPKEPLQRVLTEIRGASLPSLLPLPRLLGAAFDLDSNTPLEAEARLRLLEEAAVPSTPETAILTMHLRAWLSSREGNLVQARHESLAALQAATDTGNMLLRALCQLMVAQVLQAEGIRAEAQAAAGAATSLSRQCGAAPLILSSLLLQSLMAFDGGDAEGGRGLLQKALHGGRLAGELRVPGFSPPLLARLCGHALEAGIETVYVQEIIRLRRLRPPPEALNLSSWPWPLKIHSLGRFALVRNGHPVTFSGKVQQKPLELLKTVIALGGREIPSERLCELLWPNSPWAEGHQALNTTLHRLRRLIGVDGAVIKEEGRLGINAALVWVDLWAFHRLAGLSLKMLQEDDEARVTQGLALGRQALAIHSGPFLAGHTQSCCLPPRNRLQNRLVRLVCAIGSTHQRRGDLEAAMDCYRQGMELDGTAKEFRHRLMACGGQSGLEDDAEKAHSPCGGNLARVGG